MRSLDILKSVEEKFNAIYKLQESKGKILEMLNQNLDELKQVHLRADGYMSAYLVHRAIIIGRACRFVKDSLLHGEWTDWAREHLKEDIRTIQKYMDISRFESAETYAALGVEKVYQLSRVQSLAGEQTFESLFEDAGLEHNFQSLSTDDFEKAVTRIKNKKYLQELGLALNNASLKQLSDNLGLAKDQPNVLRRLQEAKSEDANLEKVVQSIIATNGQEGSPKKGKASKAKKNYDANAAAEIFIRALGSALEDSEALNSISPERIEFIVTLINEYHEKRQ